MNSTTKLPAKMKRAAWHLALLTTTLALFTGCTSTRSISNSNYQRPQYFDGVSEYRELNEFDVLGIDPNKSVSENEIFQAAAGAKHIALRNGSSILLVQSGATYPDGPMVSELAKHFTVVPFSGIAVEPKKEERVAIPLATERYKTVSAEPERSAYSKLIRLAAARAGADTVVCYWGILESANERMPTKTISWVPVVNWIVPDEREHMRIRVKMAVVDVRTGSWTVFSPEPFEDKDWETSPRREVVDQKQVESFNANS